MNHANTDPQSVVRSESPRPVTKARMPFKARGCVVYQWTRESILSRAPAHPGVYGLFNALWIYIGDAADIRKRLLDHLAGDNPCITHYQPSGFAFELVEEGNRERRRDEAVQLLEPLCHGDQFVHKTNGNGAHHPTAAPRPSGGSRGGFASNRG